MSEVSTARVSSLIVSFLACTLLACQLPRDADGTLDRIRRERIARIGIAEAPPWSSVAIGTVNGVEPALVTEMLRRLGASPRWVRGGESDLLRDLRKRRLDLVIGGLTDSAPWSKEVAFTTPFYTDTARDLKHVLAVAPGENAWLVHVERYLRSAEPTVPQLLRVTRP
jgi:polar amino acid transport system substrate-binding protein